MYKIKGEGYYREILGEEEFAFKGIKLFGYSKNNMALEPIFPHIHQGCAEICCIIKGNKIYNIDNIDYELSGGDLFFSEAGKLHGTNNLPNKKSEIYWMQIDLSSEENFLPLPQSLKTELFNKMRSLSSGIYPMNKQMSGLVKQAFECLSCPDNLGAAGAFGYLTAFISKLCASTVKQKNISDDIAFALNFINSSISDNIPLYVIAERSNLSLSHFKKKFKAETGFTPGDYIMSKKVQKAKELLIGGRSVTDAAFDLSFSSSSYFTVVFRHYTTMSPSEFKKQIKTENII